jgi:hypothetical protein
MLDIMEPETKDLDLSWDQRRLLALNNLKKLLLEAKDQPSGASIHMIHKKAAKLAGVSVGVGRMCPQKSKRNSPKYLSMGKTISIANVTFSQQAVPSGCFRLGNHKTLRPAVG